MLRFAPSASVGGVFIHWTGGLDWTGVDWTGLEWTGLRSLYEIGRRTYMPATRLTLSGARGDEGFIYIPAGHDRKPTNRN